jgi:hypothetical protein
MIFKTIKIGFLSMLVFAIVNMAYYAQAGLIENLPVVKAAGLAANIAGGVLQTAAGIVNAVLS